MHNILSNSYELLRHRVNTNKKRNFSYFLMKNLLYVTIYSNYIQYLLIIIIFVTKGLFYSNKL